MTITLKEAPGSSRTALGSNPTHQKLMIVAGATTDLEAQDALMADTTECPEEFTYTLTDARVWIFKKNLARVDPINEPTPTYWLGTVDYILKEFVTPPYVTDDSLTSFCIGSNTVNRKESIADVGKYPAATAPAKDGAIGIDSDGDVQGVDVDTPTFKWTETHYKASADVTAAYVDAVWLVAMSPVNNAGFRGFDAGEVRFIGLTGTRRTKDGDWELGFEFSASPNATDAAPATGIANIVKKGWEYLWFTFKRVDKTVGSAKYRMSVPEFAYVDKVYNTSDFSGLDIGTASLFP